MRIISLLLLLISTGPLQATPKVVVSIAPVHSIVTSVMKGIGRPVLLLEQSASPHDFSLKPSQARALQGADLVIWIGRDMETPLEKPIRELGSKAVLNLSIEKEFSGKDHGPHLWMNPQYAMGIASLVTRKMSELDPDNGDKFRSNLRIFKQQIKTLEDKIANIMDGAEARPFMTMHDALSPFADRFKLNLLGPVAANHAISPGISSIRKLQKRITDEHIVCLTSEYGEETPLVGILLEGNSINTVSLDLLGGKLVAGEGLYLELIENLAKDLASCLK